MKGGTRNTILGRRGVISMVVTLYRAHFFERGMCLSDIPFGLPLASFMLPIVNTFMCKLSLKSKKQKNECKNLTEICD